MIRVAMMLLLTLAACTPSDRREEAPDMEQVPIGPGSDSTTLLPPDTPVSRREPSRTGALPPRDTTT